MDINRARSRTFFDVLIMLSRQEAHMEAVPDHRNI